jgi:hypothetical protein
MPGPYYVKATPSGDESGDSEANAMSLAAAADAVAAGETVYVKADGVYEVEDGANNCVLHATTPGAVTTPIVWQGYDTTINDGGIAKINADPAGDQFANGILITGNYNVFKNFEVTGASGAGIYTTADYMTFKTCSSHDNGGDGFFTDNYTKFECCTSYSNSGDGYESDPGAIFIACIAHTNTAIGFKAQNGVYFSCIGYDNSGGNFKFDSSAAGTIAAFLYCTADGWSDADFGFEIAGTGNSQIAVVNSIFHNCSTGIDTAEQIGEIFIARNNLYNSNTADVSEFLAVSTGDGIGDRGDVEDPGAPFTGSGDYDPNAFAQAKAIDGYWTQQFWADYNEGGGDNPPAE